MSIYAVNGKIPVAAWIPSRDTAGNGTTTLNDLVGTNHGTLTNMDAATDWVADTGAGGVRALDFSSTGRDHVNFGNVCHLPNDLSVSFWVYKMATSSGFSFLWGVQRWNSGGALGSNEYACLLCPSSGNGNNPSFSIEIGSDGYYVDSSTSLTINSWGHVVCVRDGGSLRIFLNGSLSGTTNSVPTTAITNRSRNLKLADSDIASDLRNNSRMDDIRIFDTALNASDVAQLYRNGNGRGVTANSNTFQIGMPI